MTRWILLGLGDDEVDVISRLPRGEAPGNVMVYHPDPNALVLQLADLAELRRVDAPPEPGPGDVVVVGARDRNSTRAAAYRRAGARVVDPQELGAWEADPVGEKHQESGPPSSPPKAMDPSPEPEAEPAPSVESTEPSPDVWANPTRTLQWALERFGYPEAVLWWDGHEDVWVPWILPETPGRGMEPGTPEGYRVETRCGRFVLAGVDPGSQQIHRGMLTRLAEDTAWRDLAQWNEAAQGLTRLRPASRQAPLGAWEAWLDAALPLVAPAAALAWSEEGGVWRLQRAWGDGVHLAGELRLPRALFDATFGHGSSWQAWNLGGASRLVFTPSPDRPQWPLRLARLTRIVEGEARS